MKKIRIIIVLAIVCGLSVMSLFAQEPEIKPPNAEETLPSENITLDFKDADIKSVLRIIAYKSGVNIVSTPEVRGTITIRLKDVPWEQALETIVRTYGFAYEWISSKVIMVSTLARLAEQRKIQEEATSKEPLGTETFVLNFTKAEEVKEAVDKLLTDRGKSTLESRTNTLIITDTKSNLIRIGRIIDKLDKITPQVTIEAKIVETTLDDDDKLGIDWTTKVTASGAKRPTTFPFQVWEREQDFFPVGAYTSAYDAAEGWTITSNFPFWGEGFFFPKDQRRLGSFPSSVAEYKEGVLIGDYSFGTLDFSAFQAVLEILKSKTDTKVISTPRITTINNKEAKILVGTIVPIPIYSYSKEQGTRVISGYKDQEIGIKLLVTPNINERDFVTLEVKPSVDEIIDWTGPDDERPIITTRNAETKVMVKDGQTLVIGGLIYKKTIKKRTKFPILGDIPRLSLLFSKKADEVDTTDLLIFITPHIVREGQIGQEENPSTG